MPDQASGDYNGVASAIHEAIEAANHAVATSINAELAQVADSTRMIANAVLHIASVAVAVASRSAIPEAPTAGIQRATHFIAARIEAVNRAAIARTATVHLSFIAHAVNEAYTRVLIIRNCGTREAEALASKNQAAAAQEATVSLRRVADSIVGSQIPDLSGAIAEAINAGTRGDLKRVAEAICDARAAAERTVDAGNTSVDLRSVGQEVLRFAEAIGSSDRDHGVPSGAERCYFDEARATAEEAVVAGLADGGLGQLARAIKEAIAAADREVRRRAAKVAAADRATLGEDISSPARQTDEDDDDDPVNDDGHDLSELDDEYHGFDEP